jgi:hypothetical protein
MIVVSPGRLIRTITSARRDFRAYVGRNGDLLWQFRINSGIIAPPSSYEVDGVQYIAAQSGYGVDPAFQEGLISILAWLAEGHSARRRDPGVRRCQVIGVHQDRPRMAFGAGHLRGYPPHAPRATAALLAALAVAPAVPASAVEPTVDGDTLSFTVVVTPTAPGRHPINGVFRVGYIDGPSTMNMVSVPLIAAVVGTQ